MSRRASTLREMGLGPLWRLRAGALPVASVEQGGSFASPTLVATAGRGATIAALDWPQLETAVAACDACMLCRERRHAVVGTGDHAADWLFVGEGPGSEEDAHGEPFVGPAGVLLDAMLAAIGLRRGENVYLTNVVKCHPPARHAPGAEETTACWPFLERQIALLRPKLVVALGRLAMMTLLQSDMKIADARGRLFDIHGIPLIVTYHPAHLLHSPLEKAKAWEDLCFMRRTMRAS